MKIATASANIQPVRYNLDHTDNIGGATVKFGKIIGSRWFIAASGLLLGAVVVLGVRFFAYQPPARVHYHANFALYVNGQREQFEDPRYYSEAEMCSAETENEPAERAHMHDNINNVVHVEDSATTWGHFFTNLGWTLGDDLLQAPDGTVYAASGDSTLHLLLNGQDYTGLGSLADRVIKDEDRLLLSFGDQSDSAIQGQYDAIPRTAHQYDTEPDPASCSGGAKGVTLSQRLKHLF